MQIIMDVPEKIVLDFNAETSTRFNPNPSYNMSYLDATFNWLHDRLWAQGHLFVNEVLDSLGMQRTGEGAVLGWTKDTPKNRELWSRVKTRDGDDKFTITLSPDGIITDKI